MESELKELNAHPKTAPQPESDSRPLLKPESDAPSLSENPDSNQSSSIEELEKKYAPYVRYDVYGPMGRGELPWPEKFLLILALMLLLPLRVAAGTAIMLMYYVICRFCTAFLAPNREDEQEDYAHMGGWRRAVIVGSGRFLSRVLLFVFGFYSIADKSKGGQVDGELNTQSSRSTKQVKAFSEMGIRLHENKQRDHLSALDTGHANNVSGKRIMFRLLEFSLFSSFPCRLTIN